MSDLTASNAISPENAQALAAFVAGYLAGRRSAFEHRQLFPCDHDAVIGAAFERWMCSRGTCVRPNNVEEMGVADDFTG